MVKFRKTFGQEYESERKPLSNPLRSGALRWESQMGSCRHSVQALDFKHLSIFCAPAVLTFFIAGLLYLLCFANLGAYSMPS